MRGDCGKCSINSCKQFAISQGLKEFETAACMSGGVLDHKFKNKMCFLQEIY
jgi:CO dehydrogenase/acetyl-CoA synthase gamma subunit (corrinoid Fe-S protein)